MLNLYIFLILLAIGILESNFYFTFDTLIYFNNEFILLSTLGISNDNDDSKEKKKKQLPDESILVEEYLLEKINNELLYDLLSNQWYQYNVNNSNIWSPINNLKFEKLIASYIKLYPNFNKILRNSYLDNVIKILKRELEYELNSFIKKNNNLIPFKNGILDLKTKKLLFFSKDYKFTYKLTIDYDPLAKMDLTFANWLLFISNKNPLFLKILRVYTHLILTKNNNSQVALYLHGPGGTGKTTFEKIIVSIVSTQGVVASNFSRLNSKFETSKLLNKVLLLISDAEYYTGDVTVFKSIISGDLIPAEMKFQQGFEFNPNCLVLITSNHIWQPKDNSSGIMRRIIYLPFTNIPKIKDPELFYLNINGEPKGKLANSLPGFINWVLSCPEEDLDIFNKEILELNDQLSPSTINYSNTLLNWASTNLSNKKDSFTYIGNKKSPKETHLYPNYIDYCKQYGFKPISFNRFSYSLVDICNSTLGWKDVFKKESMHGTFLMNISLNSETTPINLKSELIKQVDLSYFYNFIDNIVDETSKVIINFAYWDRYYSKFVKDPSKSIYLPQYYPFN
jgi:putative DNA primase/helicase